MSPASVFHRFLCSCARNGTDDAQAARVSGFKSSRAAAMPDHKVNIPISRDRRAWWRTWKDYPNPLLDAFLTLFGIAVVVMALWFLL